MLNAAAPEPRKNSDKSAPKASVVSLPAMARAALIDAENNVPSAVEALTETLMRDRVLMRTVLLEIVSMAARELVARDILAQRQAIRSGAARGGATRPKINGRASTEIQAERTVLSYMEYPISGGLHLGNATREDVERQRDKHVENVRTNAPLARWFDAIANALPEGRTVREVLTEEDVRGMYEAAQR